MTKIRYKRKIREINERILAAKEKIKRLEKGFGNWSDWNEYICSVIADTYSEIEKYERQKKELKETIGIYSFNNKK